MNKKIVHRIAFTLLVVGGLNWLFVGVFNQNLVEEIFGSGTLAMVVYILVGLSALYELLTHKSSCATCVSKSSTSTTP
ncbi:MAG TPA: DUF378 domain-containing protein [Candidatus Paceibacterota bacterium]|nr:DUF378 domain-containing protein [Candidatus Paceibacterota bacterium]